MTTNPHTYTRVRTEQRALLAEIDQLAQGSTTPISLDAIAALAIPAGGSLHAQPAPIRALPHVLRCLEQKGLVTVDRNGRSWSNGSLDWSKSTATVTAAGRTLLRPNPAKRLDTPITPPPTWRLSAGFLQAGHLVSTSAENDCHSSNSWPHASHLYS